MVQPSRERLLRLAREIVSLFARSRTVVLLKSREAVEEAVCLALSEELQRQGEREENAHRRISRLRGAPKPETREWHELFRRLIEEEILRESLDG
jgi:hypothetical protein